MSDEKRCTCWTEPEIGPPPFEMAIDVEVVNPNCPIHGPKPDPMDVVKRLKQIKLRTDLERDAIDTIESQREEIAIAREALEGIERKCPMIDRTHYDNSVQAASQRAEVLRTVGRIATEALTKLQRKGEG